MLSMFQCRRWRVPITAALLPVILGATGCGSGGSSSDGSVGGDAARGLPDSAMVVPDGAAVQPDAASCSGTFEAGVEPTTAMVPIAGELSIRQLDLPPGITARLAEAAVIVGPDGSIVLLDVGNSPHDDDLRDVVRELNTNVLTPARGFPRARAALEVDWIVLTHFHGDHVGALKKLMTGSEPLQVTKGIVHRGFVDVGAGMNTADYGEVCTLMRGSLAALDTPLCVAKTAPPCDFARVDNPHPATGCPGLLRGDLARTEDDDRGAASYMELGNGARITLFAADTQVASRGVITPMAAIEHESNDSENARSLAGMISYGEFRYYFGGDMHGRASDGFDVESHLVDIAGAEYFGTLGVDVVHAHHHARRTSSNSTFVAAATPADGRSRNVIAGINGAHLGSPYAEVLAAWGEGNRLANGSIWVTTVTAGGATSDTLQNADGEVRLQTIQAGRGYRIQRAGTSLGSAAFESLRHQACD